MATADPGEDPTCLQCSFKIGKVVYDVTLTQTKLSWVKKGNAVEKSGMAFVFVIPSLIKQKHWEYCYRYCASVLACVHALRFSQ